MSTVLDNRIPVTINVDANTGEISWDKRLVDHNSDVFHRGKTVTNTEFNDLFVRHSYQNNYLADSLEQLLNGGKLRSAVSGTFRSEFELKPSYVKVFGTSDWGSQQSDGYYYISIPASEHGFTQIEHSENPADNMNIDTEMYLLAADGKFYEVMQVTVDQNNNVTIYTDDNTLIGFIVIRLNDRSYVLQDAVIDAAQVRGLADVAYNGKYTSLTDRAVIEDRVTAVEEDIDKLTSDTEGTYPFVHNADFATDAHNAVHLGGEDATINNILISNIFEPGSRVVQEATHASSADNATNATNAAEATHAAEATYASSDTTKGTIDSRLDTLASTIKRELLWSGNLQLNAGAGYQNVCNVTTGDVLEIWCQIGKAIYSTYSPISLVGMLDTNIETTSYVNYMDVYDMTVSSATQMTDITLLSESVVFKVTSGVLSASFNYMGYKYTFGNSKATYGQNSDSIIVNGRVGHIIKVYKLI